MINNDVHILIENFLRGYHKYKIIDLRDQILLLLQLENNDISRLTSSHPSSHLTYVQTFNLKVESFTKILSDFGMAKY